MLKRTRLSLYYVVCYILTSGFGFVFLPELSLKLMMSNGNYDLTFVRLCGIFLIGLGILVLQIVRLEIAALYTTTMFVRVIFCISYIVFYFQTRDPFFLAVLGIVGLGLTMSTLSYWSEKNRKVIAH